MILRAEVTAKWSSFVGQFGRVVSTHEDPTGHYALVWLDGEDRALRFGLESINLRLPPPPDRSSER